MRQFIWLALIVVMLAVVAGPAMAKEDHEENFATEDGSRWPKTDRDELLKSTVDEYKLVVTEAAALPVRLMSVPYLGMHYATDGVGKIENETGRSALQLVMAPLWIPAAILHLPEAGLSLIAPDWFWGF